MSLQTKNKKGISVMIGYILLISFAVILGSVIYTWVKAYVPNQGLECPEGVSLFVKDAQYDCSTSLVLTLKNNGRFNFAGYFIHSTDEEDQEIATIDISEYAYVGIQPMSGVVLFDSIPANTLEPGQEIIDSFTLPGTTYYSIEIIPIRFQEDRNKIASCGNARVKYDFTCP